MEYETDFDASEELVQAVGSIPPSIDGEPIEAMLTKFVLIAEWIDEDGKRWLTRCSSNGVGETITDWDMDGMLHQGLYGAW